MWSNGDLSTNALLASYVARYPEAFELRVANIRELSKGTPLENSPLLSSNDEKAWLDDDLIRLLVIWRESILPISVKLSILWQPSARSRGHPPFKILPFGFSDARACRLDNRLPDPFEPDPSDGH
ncbi:hypothetical protein EDB89DRAFT_2123418 [Lactarius sanguifluus]|nr:hypothetical protein EDB89DRAFT_2123418 [Lactarius sanguifluus]